VLTVPSQQTAVKLKLQSCASCASQVEQCACQLSFHCPNSGRGTKSTRVNPKSDRIYDPRSHSEFLVGIAVLEEAEGLAVRLGEISATRFAGALPWGGNSRNFTS
jgi:predicted RNA-binding Zn-ribbon protein involved in translation (DUF1610 family)